MAACAIAVTFGLNVHAEKAPPGGTARSAGPTGSGARGLTAAIPRPAGVQGGIAGGVIAGSSYATGFEPAEGFAPGHIDGQVGWASFASSSAEAHIDTVNPAAGEQHLRISKDPNLGLGADVGAFSPNLGIFENVSGTLSVDLNISSLGGTTYEVVPQTPTEGLVVTRVQFLRTRDIWVLNAAGVFEDSGADWVPGVYKNVTVVLDVVLGTLEVFYDGALIHSLTPIPNGDAIQEVVLIGNNNGDDDVGDFDNLEIIGGALPTGACCNFDGQSGCQIMDPDACLAAGGVYLGNDTLCDACPTGACCNFDGNGGCEIMSPYQCEGIQDAFYWGDDTLCADCPEIPTNCGPGAGDCFADNGTPGCEDVACCAQVCATADLAYCCFVTWDLGCATAAVDICVIEPACGAPGTDDCFDLDNPSPYCDDNCDGVPCPGCCATVCALDPYCCETTWDDICNEEAVANCGCTPQDAPANDDCAAAIPVVEGDYPYSTLCGSMDGPVHPGGPCDQGFGEGGTVGLDIWYLYTASSSGSVRVLTCETADYDTEVAVYDSDTCPVTDADLIECNDDGAGCTDFGSEVIFAATGGVSYLIRVGGIYSTSGTGVLSIQLVPVACETGTGDCIAPHGGVGCQDLACCASVCAQLPECCNIIWDQACADVAAQFCPPFECVGIDLGAATIEEPEPCGLDVNGGCNNLPSDPTFTVISSGDVMHGTAWADLDARDTDWYLLTVTAEDDVDGNGFVEVHYNVQAELPVISFLIDDQNNPPGCVDTSDPPDGAADGLETPGTNGYGQSCAQVGVGVAGVEAPGEYYIWAGTGDAAGNAIFNGYPCPVGAAFGNDYLLCVTVTDDGEPFDPTCPPIACPCDCADGGDGVVNVLDFLALIGEWGGPGACDCADGGDGVVNVLDFLALIGVWGPC
ncbi:MAG: hypothetical protein ACYSUF_02165 [Planctomycetota bacterium]